jgi:hypothetical protein
MTGLWAISSAKSATSDGEKPLPIGLSSSPMKECIPARDTEHAPISHDTLYCTPVEEHKLRKFRVLCREYKCSMTADGKLADDDTTLL